MRKPIFIFFLILIFLLSLVPAKRGDAARVDELKNLLQDRESEIKKLEEEINQYQKSIQETNREAVNLKERIKQLNLAITKLNADTQVTKRRLEFSKLMLEKLTLDIALKETQINTDKKSLNEIIKLVNESAGESLVEILLAHASLSDFFLNLEYFDDLQKVIQNTLSELHEKKQSLEEEKSARSEEKGKFLALARELNDRTVIEKNTRNEQSSLLKVTQKKETEYKKMLEERLRKKNALEDELRKIEEELRITIDPSSLPRAGSGVLGWPLEDLSLASCWTGGGTAKNCVTQYFGNTDFATANPQAYNGKGHNGIDFRASVGMAVTASAEGVVRAIGNTDNQCRGVSYGEWILIDHPNNLSTLYAHLSRTIVSEGKHVSRGERIGYSGITGYSTGPHLHFTVFASKAVNINEMRSRICGTLMRLPLAPYNGYLNPLSYL